MYIKLVSPMTDYVFRRPFRVYTEWKMYMVTRLTVYTMYMDTMNDDDMQCSYIDTFLSLLSLLI